MAFGYRKFCLFTDENSECYCADTSYAVFVSSLPHAAHDRDIGKAVLLVVREVLKLKPVWFSF